MEFLTPILHREFLVRSRRRETYFVRLGTAAVSLLVLGVIVGLPMLVGTPMGRSGALVFQACANLLWFFCLLEGVRVSIDSLSAEKREGTIGLLFLTRMKGVEVVVGKFSSNFIGSVFNLLAALPVLGLMILLGGVGIGEFFRVCLALVSTLTVVLSLGMLVSARSLYAGRALAAMVLVLVVWEVSVAIVSELSGGFLPSPKSVVDRAFETEYMFAAQSYWISIGSFWVISLLAAIGAGFTLEGFWRDSDVSEKQGGARKRFWSRWVAGFTKRRLGDWLPIRWLLIRRSGMRFVKPFAVSMVIIAGVLAFVLPVGFGLGGMCSWVILGVAIIEGCRLFVGSEGRSSLELVLTTSVRVGDVLLQIRQHAHRFALQGALIVLVLELMGFILGSAYTFWRDGTVPAGLGMLGPMNAQMGWSEFLNTAGAKLVDLGLGAVAYYFWFSGVYCFSLWCGARSSSLTGALGKTCVVIFLGFGVFLWVGTMVLMMAVFLGGRGVTSSPLLILVFMSLIRSGLMIVFFGVLRRYALRQLLLFLMPSLPMSHAMVSKRIVSLR